MKKVLIGLLIVIYGCQNTKYVRRDFGANLITLHVGYLTDVIVHDIFNPPAASRVYIYPLLGLYECLSQTDSTFRSFENRLHAFKGIERWSGEDVDLLYAGLTAFYDIAAQLVNSGYLMQQHRAEMETQFDYLPGAVRERSLQYGSAVAKEILDYAKGDRYDFTRTLPNYNVSDSSGLWIPTPPDYMEAIEPNWKKMRTLVLDSANQFIPEPPPSFSKEKGSRFYDDAIQVYQTVNNLNTEEKEVANFWDCNPFVTQHFGHVMLGNKKISPGGHWMGIASIASLKASLSAMEAAYVHVVTAIALFDAFISCWDEKYRSNLIRPETYINQLIDKNWGPELVTPPFPEYTSGHSVISRASAVVLTEMLGENFQYSDTVENKYGLPTRQFDSFLQASEEAAISRLYGGIHYLPAITNGVQQGEKVGELIDERLDIKTLRND